jgi:hypothetical protein
LSRQLTAKLIKVFGQATRWAYRAFGVRRRQHDAGAGGELLEMIAHQ